MVYALLVIAFLYICGVLLAHIMWRSITNNEPIRLWQNWVAILFWPSLAITLTYTNRNIKPIQEQNHLPPEIAELVMAAMQHELDKHNKGNNAKSNVH